MTSNSIVAVVQARMSSKRLPGKVLCDLGGQSILELLIRRLKRSREVVEIVVTTSTGLEDDSIEDAAHGLCVPVVRGPLDNVAKRFCLVAQQFTSKSILRVCADSPFYDPVLVDEAVARFRKSQAKFLTTSSPRTTPHGLSIEIFDTDLLLNTYPDFENESDYEHVTHYFYRNRDSFLVTSFDPCLHFKPNLSLAVDTPHDLVKAKQIYSHFGERIEDVAAQELIAVAELSE